LQAAPSKTAKKLAKYIKTMYNIERW